MILVALRNKVGEAGIKHYGIAERDVNPPIPVSDRIDIGGGDGMVDRNRLETSPSPDEGGVYL